MIKVESNQPELFDHSIMGRDGPQPSYLQDAIESIKSNPVLELALTDSSVSSLSMLKDSPDPKEELRKNLSVLIMPNTHWIRVSIESKKNKDAADIVNAVVGAYEVTNADVVTNESTKVRKNKNLAKVLVDNLERYENDLKNQIEEKRGKLIEYAGSGLVEFEKPTLSVTKAGEDDQPPQPAFNAHSLEQYRTTKDLLMQTEFQIMELEAQYTAKQAEQQPGKTSIEAPVLASNDGLRERIIQEFRHDTEVASLTEQIRATNEELDHVKGVVRKGADPGRLALKKKLDSLTRDYEDLWKTKSEEIHQRLLVPTSSSGAPELDNLVEIKRKLDSLKGKRARLTELIDKFTVDKKRSITDTVKATFERDDLSRLNNMYDQVHRKLESLKFSGDDKTGIYIPELIPAEIPKVPNKNKRFMYTALLPVGVLFAVVGLFLLLEVRAERVGDPDMLSSRVQSEVYALPPLPTARTARKLSGPTVDDQIERFIQRLDHLRFAVCGDHHATEMGRCVLVTSAVGGEGKTTLAAQLAARCGNAGVSTLLIDADLRRASLGPLLDVPEGPGLSDVLEGARFEDVVIPVQGGTFHLLCAGTPIQDTSRLFQGRNLAMLIAQLRQSYELIFIDSPPVLPVPDALILGAGPMAPCWRHGTKSVGLPRWSGRGGNSTARGFRFWARSSTECVPPTPTMDAIPTLGNEQLKPSRIPRARPSLLQFSLAIACVGGGLIPGRNDTTRLIAVARSGRQDVHAGRSGGSVS